MSSPKFVFSAGVIIGLFISSFFIETSKIFKIYSYKPVTINIQYDNRYDTWLNKSGYVRKYVSNDQIYYSKQKYYLEADFLKERVPILCAVQITAQPNADGCFDTWVQHCNKHIFYGLPSVLLKNTTNYNVTTLRAKSSWHLLCETILTIAKNYKNEVKFVLFVLDDVFVIPENLRVKLAAFDGDTEDIYLGHTVNFWGVNHNVRTAGFVLSMSVIRKLATAFQSYGACENSGKYWKTEDWYLGKHLADLGIYPTNPNVLHSYKNLSIFHGYTVEKSLFPGSNTGFSRYHTNSVFPATCCSEEAVTFYATKGEAMYQYNFLLYMLHIFKDGGYLGNQPAPTPMTVEQVWRKSVKEFYPNFTDANTSMSAQQYYDMWKTRIGTEIAATNDEANLKYISNIGILNDILSSSGFLNKTKL